MQHDRKLSTKGWQTLFSEARELLQQTLGLTLQQSWCRQRHREMAKFVIELSTTRLQDVRHDLRPYLQEVFHNISHLYKAQPAASSKNLLESRFSFTYHPWSDYPLVFNCVDWKQAMDNRGMEVICVLKNCLLSLPEILA